MRTKTCRGWIAAASLTLVSLPAWGGVQPQGHELRVNSRTDFRQLNPASAFAPNGRVLVVWENDQRGLRGQFLGSDGLAVGSELTLVESDPIVGSTLQTIKTRHDPSVAFLAGGGFVLAWTEEREQVESFAFIETRTILDQDVFLQRFDATGRPLGPRVTVNTSTAGLQRQPRLVARSQGDFLVLWESADGGIFSRVLNAAGQLTGGETRINEAAGAHPVGAAGTRGTSLIAWEVTDGANGAETGLFARLLNTAGQPLGPVFRVNAQTAGVQRRATVAAGADGSFLVAWQTDLQTPTRSSRVSAQAVGFHGNLMGPQLTLFQGFGSDISRMAPALAAAPGGHFLVSWLGFYTDDSPGLQMAVAEIDALGNTVGSPVWLNEVRVQRNFRRTAIAAKGTGSYLLSWETVTNGRQSIAARRLGAS